MRLDIAMVYRDLAFRFNDNFSGALAGGQGRRMHKARVENTLSVVVE